MKNSKKQISKNKTDTPIAKAQSNTKEFRSNKGGVVVYATKSPHTKLAYQQNLPFIFNHDRTTPSVKAWEAVKHLEQEHQNECRLFLIWHDQLQHQHQFQYQTLISPVRKTLLEHLGSNKAKIESRLYYKLQFEELEQTTTLTTKLTNDWGQRKTISLKAIRKNIQEKIGQKTILEVRRTVPVPDSDSEDNDK